MIHQQVKDSNSQRRRQIPQSRLFKQHLHEDGGYSIKECPDLRVCLGKLFTFYAPIFVSQIGNGA